MSGARRSPVTSMRAMVATGHPLAAEAACSMLRVGGSAIDAAIAADAVMGVVEPMATSIGGDLLAMIVAPDGRPITYNGTGRAPQALTADLVDSLPGRRIAQRHPLSITTPGAVRGWHDLHRRYGRLPWSDLFQPAIHTANAGFTVAPVAAREWKLFESVIAADPVSAELYRAGRVPAAGEHYANPLLGRLLAEIAAEGPAAFYSGRVPQAAQAHVQACGGVLAASDFARHAGEFREALSAPFRDLTVLACPPNTHGVAVLDALTAVNDQPLDRDDPRSWVRIVQAMDEAMEHAQRTVADPAGNTVCTAVVDAEGLGITLMSSVFKRFGSGISVPGCGFVLQNRGFGFSEPGHVNGPAPGKRPYHTVVPGAALKDGRLHAVFGVVGGAMQPQGQVQLLVRMAAWGEAMQPAMDAPRWRLESRAALAIEAGMPDGITQALRQAGYASPDGKGELGGRSDFGGAQMVSRLSDGRLAGGSDRRKDGCARGL